MTTETREQWIMGHVNAVRELAHRNRKPLLDTFSRVRYMITNEGMSTFHTSKDLSVLVESVLNALVVAEHAELPEGRWTSFADVVQQRASQS